MLRSLAWTGVVLLGGTASAQQPLEPTRVHPITSTVRDAGTYHLATGTWTRKASQANLGADTIYDNTCTSGYFGSLSGDHFIDEGRIPSPAGPSDQNARPGCSMQYTVDGFQIGYCTDQPSMGTYTVSFFETYLACSTVLGITPTGRFAITGLPASLGSGTCWTATIDLVSPPQSASLAFDMIADGFGPNFRGGGNTSLFGWDSFSSLPGSSSTLTGPILAGDPSVCSGFDGTRWDVVVNYAEAGTGMGTLNQFRIEPSGAPGCYYFPNVPMSSFHLELYADACSSPVCCASFCIGDSSGTHCPCNNHSGLGNDEGCRHSLGTGGKLTGTGTASLSADTVTLLGTRMPNASALYFQGTTPQNAGAGTVLGDGKLCAGGSPIRLKTVTNVAGASQYPESGDPSVSVRGLITGSGIRTYQVWYRNAATFCTPATFNLTNGVVIAWSA